MEMQTLILNQSYRPHEIVCWQDAVTRMFTGKIEVMSQYDEFLARLDKTFFKTNPDLKKALRQVVGVDIESFDLKVPAVGVLLRHVRPVKSGVKFSKINVCLRDKFCCQYCGTKHNMSLLNYDHVVPRAHGGRTEWDNIVMSCYVCNSAKADRTPLQAGMTLLSKPVKPRYLPMNEPMINADSAPEEWQPYIQVA